MPQPRVGAPSQLEKPAQGHGTILSLLGVDRQITALPVKKMCTLLSPSGHPTVHVTAVTPPSGESWHVLRAPFSMKVIWAAK